METKAKVVKMKLTGKKSRELGQAIYRFCREADFKLSQFCQMIDVPVRIPSSLYFKSQASYPEKWIHSITNGLGYPELSEALTYGSNADLAVDKPVKVNGSLKKSRGFKRRHGKIRAIAIVKAPTTGTLIEQIEVLSKADQAKVKKLVAYLSQKAAFAELEEEIRSF